MSEHKIVVYSGNNEEETLQFCTDKVKELQKDGLTTDDILFLYRRSKMSKPYYFRFKEEGLWVQWKTIHAAKGLEAKVVFIVGLTEGYGGFPDIWLEDRIFQVIKKANQQLEIQTRFWVQYRDLFWITLNG